MDYLWTPWRYQYITTPAQKNECVFCAAAQCPDDLTSLIAYRAEHNFVILNRFPYTNGHIMVVPYRHEATLEGLTDEVAAEMMRLAQRAERHLRALYNPDGLNMGLNIGHAAGAGVAGHVHLHILPRWVGDTNFMTATSETRVLPEDLTVTWEKVRAAFGG